MNDKNGTKHVVIVGGGFAGLGCARKLSSQKKCGLRSSTETITTSFSRCCTRWPPLFWRRPMWPSRCADYFASTPTCDVKLAEVASVDPKAKTVTTRSGEVYQGDYLVLAAGSQANFFRTPGADQHTFPLYSLDDAERLRSRILQVFEDADRDPKLVDEGALNFVIVGAGPTGTEMAGALAEMINTTMTVEYHDLAVTPPGSTSSTTGTRC